MSIEKIEPQPEPAAPASEVTETASEPVTEAAAPEAVNPSPSETAAEAETAPPVDAASSDPAESDMPQGEIPEGAISDAPSGDENAEREFRALIEAIVYITDEPLSAQQIANGLERPLEEVQKALDALVAEYQQDHRGLTVREVAGGYRMGTKPEHHEAVRAFVKTLKPPLKLSLAALETLAVIAYKQPITGPEIMEIRGVQGGGVLKTLLDRKLIATAGRKAVVGKPMLYKTTKEFLLQFGLNGLAELPSLKEFEELKRLALSEEDVLGGDAPVSTPEEQEAQAAEALAATKDAVPDEATAETAAAPPPDSGAENA